jgi:hypothetical protein
MDLTGFAIAISPIGLTPGASFAMAINNAARVVFVRSIEGKLA